MNLKTTILILFSANISILVPGQEAIITESDTHIFWQPNNKLTQEDFLGKASLDNQQIRLCDSAGVCTMACTGLFAVLDIPKRKSDRRHLFEKAYFAPAFDKINSYSLLRNDSIGVYKQQIVFDLVEVVARMARKELISIQDSIKGIGAVALFFKSVEARANKNLDKFIDAYTFSVFILKEEGAWEKWRTQVDEFLDTTNEYATTPEDCYRFVKNEPLSKKYIMAPLVVDNLYND